MEPDLSDNSFEIPSMIEAISSSIDGSQFNFDELEKSSDSDHRSQASWSPAPESYYQSSYHHSQWNNYQQPSYSPYHQYGYMTPSPYNSYYMQSPPVEYQPQPYHYYEQNYAKEVEQQHNCTTCGRTFKSAANLTRHYMSKSHLKKLESKTNRPMVVKVKKVRNIGSAFTDISKTEREFLWQLDDEIFKFLKIYEEEKSKVLPTPPLSPTKLQRFNTIESISSSSPEPSRPQSVESIEMNFNQNNGHFKRQRHEYESPRSCISSPSMMINEKGEEFEIIYSDANLSRK